ncbi:PREDICTED: protein OSCP1 [Nicrophorus vespilloides]|uniref:Protein OSCP1 n=1 Tax=Nicrophorus vespilloides TaxID=110193 RepID=A0ABM1M7A6_NICVS|nr:PREDICTED: protein OSCP1 [Nicrophorus vespilloides]
MSRYVTPFLVVNLGAEMVFVVAQRLQAQNIPHDRSAFVLDEIISVLVSQQLMSEITKPQAAYSHESVKNLIEDVTQSSAMRLDPKSMDKLWDLITMVFKWQVFLTFDLLKITSRHLYEIENYVTSEETHLQLHKVQNLFDNFNKILTDTEKVELREHVFVWLSNFNVRVSLLLRLGLQDQDGNFIITNLNPFAKDMLKNVGENIYSVTQNGKVSFALPEKQEVKNDNEVFELKLLVDQINGGRKEINRNNLRLTINQKNEPEAGGSNFNCINVEATNSHNLENLFDDLNLNEDNASNFHEDLITMIGEEE